MKKLRKPITVTVTANGTLTLDSLGHPEAERWKISRTALSDLDVTPVLEDGSAWDHPPIRIPSTEKGNWIDLDGIDSFIFNNLGGVPDTITLTPYVD